MYAQSSNTNVLHWAGKLLALREDGTITLWNLTHSRHLAWTPFGNQIITTAFTAHPKIDPNVEELVTWGTLGEAGIISYSVDRQVIVKNDHYIKTPRPTSNHGWMRCRVLCYLTGLF